MSFNGENANNVTEAAASQTMGAQQRQQLLELTNKFKALVNEAKSVGENTPRGKELLMKASRIKAIYDNYNRQRQQAAQALSQARNGNGTGTSSSGSPSSTAGGNVAGSSSSGSNQQARGGSGQLASIIKQVLTPEQNQQHEALSQNFQERANNIRGKHTFLKQHIERLNQEVSKQTDPAAKKQLEDKKAELTNSLKMLNMEYSVLQQEFQNGKKKFYVECARHNPALQRLLQRSTQQQRMAQQQQQGQPMASGSPPARSAEGRPESSGVGESQAPAKNQPETPSNVTTQKLPQQTQVRSQPQATSTGNRAPTQITNVNAAASLSYNNGANRSAIFKQTDPVVPISDTVTAKTPSPVTYKTNRPTLTGGTAMNAAALNTPTMTKLPPYEVDTERVMSKRKLRELVKTVGIDEGDGETVIDGDVESLLLDLADDFVSNVTGFACRLAKHRKSDSLDTRDIQLHLERNWNIRIPGYSADEIRSSRKSNPKPVYNQKLQAINSDKAASMKNNPTDISGMVKSYQRFEQADAFGVISSSSNCVFIPPASKKGHSIGQVITSSLEKVNIWDLKTAELVAGLSDGLPPGSIDAKSTKPAEVTCLEHHAETNLLAQGSADGVIKVWDLMSQTVLLTLNGHKSAVTILKFDSTGTRLISGSQDSNIIVWDLVGEVGLYRLRSHKDAISGLWVQEDSWLVSTSKDGFIKVWDLKTQQCIETHIAHTGECWALGIYDDFAVTTGADSQVKIWQLRLENDAGSKLTEKGVFDKESKQRGSFIEFVTTVDGSTFFFIQNADKTVEVFRIRREEEIAKASRKREKRLQDKGMTDEEIQKNISDAYISMIVHRFQLLRSSFKIKSATWAQVSSSKLDIIVTTSNNTIEYYSIPYQKKDPKLPAPIKLHSIELQGHRTDVRAMDISNDSSLLATASNGSLKIWNLKTRKCLRTFECGYALCCKFLPGGFLIVVGTRNGELQLFDLASSTMLDYKEAAHDAAIWSLDITVDGKKLITGSADKTVKFWAFKVAEIPLPGAVDKSSSVMKISHDTILELNDDVLCVRLSPENRYLAVSLLDNTVKVFYFDTMKFYLSLYGHKLPVLSIDISFDSKMIITSSADKNIKIWGLDFGDCHKSLFAHQDSIMSVRFLPESHNFFSCSKDALVKYWDGDKFECIQKLAGHQSEVWCLSISNDGRYVVSASHDRSIRIWEETEDQVFLEEEREKELEEQYEGSLLSSLEEGSADAAFKSDVTGNEEEQNEATDVRKQTIESLKAGERLMEALDLGIPEIENEEQYEQDMKLWNKKKIDSKPVKPVRHAILTAIDKTPQQYIMETLSRIHPSQLEDALLVLPFSYVLKFLKFIDKSLLDERLFQHNLPLICKNLFFIIRSNHRELVSQKNEELKLRIARVKDRLRKALKVTQDDLGFNIEGLFFIRQQWNLRHKFEFADDYSQKELDDKSRKKRVFETLA